MCTLFHPPAAAEYARALERYRCLMRHRIANPLTVIRGMAQTLRDVEDLAADLKEEMLEAIIEQARVLCSVSLEPRIVDQAEQELDPWPTCCDGPLRLDACESLAPR